MTDTSFREPLIERAQALTIVRYLAIGAQDRLPYWSAIFGDCIVSDINDEVTTVKEVRDELEKAYGVDAVKRVIDMVRLDKIDRLATERQALSEQSMDGLYDLISRIDSANAGRKYSREAMTVPWAHGAGRPATYSGDVLPFNRKELGA